MSLSATDYLLWAAGAALLVLTGGLLLKRRLVRELPVFFAYVAFQVSQTALLFTIHVSQLQHRMSYADYFYTFWGSRGISVILGFAVVSELYCRVFQNYEAIRRFAGIVFGAAAVVLLLAAVVTASSSGADTPGMIKVLVLLERSVRLMQCGLVFFLFLAAFYFGFSWKNHLFGIAMGFGVCATIDLVAIAVRFHLGAMAGTAYSQVRAAAYCCGMLIWVWYLLAPEPAPQYAGVVPLSDLEKWNQTVLEMLER